MGQVLTCDNAASKTEDGEVRGVRDSLEEEQSNGELLGETIVTTATGCAGEMCADINEGTGEGEASPKGQEAGNLDSAEPDYEMEQQEEPEVVQEQEIISEVEFVEPEARTEEEEQAAQAAREAARSAAESEEAVGDEPPVLQLPVVEEPLPVAPVLTLHQKIMIEQFLKENKYKDIHTKKIKTGCASSADYPLHAAAKKSKEELVKSMLLAGADKTKLNHKKQTAQQLTKKGSPIWNLLA
eukprot:GEMP01018667.1.p1 GENE.GEMP01018667.1~~GEMP01018667.1.p1  ORF type:complete len:241 (+),score=63.23 GEMP01018667.1:103-825(+)